jgi:hypothetical protein
MFRQTDAGSGVSLPPSPAPLVEEIRLPESSEPPPSGRAADMATPDMEASAELSFRQDTLEPNAESLGEASDQRIEGLLGPGFGWLAGAGEKVSAGLKGLGSKGLDLMGLGSSQERGLDAVERKSVEGRGTISKRAEDGLRSPLPVGNGGEGGLTKRRRISDGGPSPISYGGSDGEGSSARASMLRGDRLAAGRVRREDELTEGRASGGESDTASPSGLEKRSRDINKAQQKKGEESSPGKRKERSGDPNETSGAHGQTSKREVPFAVKSAPRPKKLKVTCKRGDGRPEKEKASPQTVTERLMAAANGDPGCDGQETSPEGVRSAASEEVAELAGKDRRWRVADLRLDLSSKASGSSKEIGLGASAGGEGNAQSGARSELGVRNAGPSLRKGSQGAAETVQKEPAAGRAERKSSETEMPKRERPGRLTRLSGQKEAVNKPVGQPASAVDTFRESSKPCNSGGAAPLPSGVAPEPPLFPPVITLWEQNVDLEGPKQLSFRYTDVNLYPSHVPCQSRRCTNAPNETRYGFKCLCPPVKPTRWTKGCKCKDLWAPPHCFERGCVAARFLGRGALKKMRVYDTGAKGLGVKAMEVIEKGDVIAEKCGEVRLRQHFAPAVPFWKVSM